MGGCPNGPSPRAYLNISLLTLDPPPFPSGLRRRSDVTGEKGVFPPQLLLYIYSHALFLPFSPGNVVPT